MNTVSPATWARKSSVGCKALEDLFLIQRRGRQQAALQLSGASVELQGQLSIRIEVCVVDFSSRCQAPGSPVLVIRLDNDGETMRWLTALQGATQRAHSLLSHTWRAIHSRLPGAAE